MATLWKWLCTFAYRRMMVGDPQRRIPDGIPFIRDADNRCESFEPRKYQLGDWRECQTDGHYLCNKCCHRNIVAAPFDEIELAMEQQIIDGEIRDRKAGLRGWQ